HRLKAFEATVSGVIEKGETDALFFFVRVGLQHGDTVVVAVGDVDGFRAHNHGVGMTPTIRGNAIFVFADQGAGFDNFFQRGGRRIGEIKNVNRGGLRDVRVAQTRNGVLSILINIAAADAFRIDPGGGKIAWIHFLNLDLYVTFSVIWKTG